ncbi:Sar family guanine nucleotide exchange factor SEC12 NDAI_0K01580 [Naumovozyma dairenensis CBS 421]|uniref:Guanine nucleotide-exchange factor SEC12 n=1 Tax=Naumovozyma dairenensis (strain ATCC 10597 / BCRC 20456 / CBS 421 / NBRC 0211 / NRRL Y-12639) TaxID=1071378 RepID=G0WHT8_NAUDC|nr:hypothetical protein NDAI_0K01580 [Naumovozyma dairenensis CBS 421]CCD27349.1 hypothetical protein NDAI_0K01580 [Naumovozyma dairenensis CBS 421]
MVFKSQVYDIKYPLYGASFLDNENLVVLGGGGEGRNGVPNKVSLVHVDLENETNEKKRIKLVDEFELNSEDDSPTAMDVTSDRTILFSCNENSNKILQGHGNRHIRKFQIVNENNKMKLKFVESKDFDHFEKPDDYTKLLYVSNDGSLAAIASSTVPAIIRVIDPKDLTEIYEIDSAHEVKDLNFSPNGKILGYITDSSLEVISTVTGSSIIRKMDFIETLDIKLSKFRFINDDTMLILGSLIHSKGIIAVKISLKKGKAIVLKSKCITTNVKGVTAMDVDLKGELLAFAGNDNSLTLVQLRKLSCKKVFKQVHQFAITRVCFSKNSKYLVSVSAANTIHVIHLPESYRTSLSLTESLTNFFVKSFFVLFLALIVQQVYEKELSSKIYNYYQSHPFSLRKLIKRDNVNRLDDDFFDQTTLVGSNGGRIEMETHDIVSTMTTHTAIEETFEITTTSDSILTEPTEKLSILEDTNEDEPINIHEEPTPVMENNNVVGATELPTQPDAETESGDEENIENDANIEEASKVKQLISEELQPSDVPGEPETENAVVEDINEHHVGSSLDEAPSQEDIENINRDSENDEEQPGWANNNIGSSEEVDHHPEVVAEVPQGEEQHIEDKFEENINFELEVNDDRNDIYDEVGSEASDSVQYESTVTVGEQQYNADERFSSREDDIDDENVAFPDDNNKD